MYLVLGLSAWGCGDGDGDGFGMTSPAGSAVGLGLCCWSCAEHRRTRVGDPQKGSVGLWMGTGQEEVAPPACPRLLEQPENWLQSRKQKQGGLEGQSIMH